MPSPLPLSLALPIHIPMEGGSQLCDILLSSSGEFEEASFASYCNGNGNEILGFNQISELNSWLFLPSSSSCDENSCYSSIFSDDNSNSSADNLAASVMLHQNGWHLQGLVAPDASLKSKIFLSDKANLKRKYDAEDESFHQKRKSKGESENESFVRGRAKRRSATDPQSVYARKRRERINERLKILQNLVPNGTKVDISTMLEQAIQYVKFMQLQIKLLSSDEHWMYTPIAFNGCSSEIAETAGNVDIHHSRDD